MHKCIGSRQCQAWHLRHKFNYYKNSPSVKLDVLLIAQLLTTYFGSASKWILTSDTRFRNATPVLILLTVTLALRRYLGLSFQVRSSCSTILFHSMHVSNGVSLVLSLQQYWAGMSDTQYLSSFLPSNSYSLFLILLWTIVGPTQRELNKETECVHRIFYKFLLQILIVVEILLNLV